MNVPAFMLCAACLLLPSALFAQDADSQARRIKSREEYRGYRVERTPGSEYTVDGSTGEPGGSEAEAGPRRDTRLEPRESEGRQSSRSNESLGSAPGWLTGLFEVVAWLVLIGGICVAVFFIVKALIGVRFGRRHKPDKAEASRDKEPAAPDEPDEDEPVAPDVFEDALAAARRDYEQALSQGDFARATLLAYRIFWLRAGWEGCVQEQDVRTWRDALRMVRGRQARRHLARLLPMVERVRYAGYHPEREEFQNWHLKVEQVDPAGVLK